ncbi:MAG: tryptophan--tRNA ligase [Candidatus Lightella neohaematopini]|nr:tryptophan--tRNA ligase [Candidatus Lightella neohaematopini]
MSIKNIVFSAMQPSNNLTIGNYIGAIKQWISIQSTYKCIYCIADLHAITNNNYNNLKTLSLNTLALYLACGVDPDTNIICLQSKIAEHSQLHWILSCHVSWNKLKHMTQFKNKYMKYNHHLSNKITVGLFTYPILMTSDILLYQTNYVPVGYDQKQHLEFSREIAKNFNKKYGNIFTIPKPIIAKISKITSLLNPTKKMSKSDINNNNYISLLDKPELVIKKINDAITDSDNPPIIKYDLKNKPGISNLLNILSVLTNINIINLEKDLSNINYKQLKKIVANEINNILFKIQKKYFSIRNKEKYLNSILISGNKKAKIIAKNTLNKVHKVINMK